MARNKIADLNDHLFAQLERLNDETIKPDQMELEFEKARAISSVAAQIIKANKLTIDAIKLLSMGCIGPNDLPDTFGVKKLNQ